MFEPENEMGVVALFCMTCEAHGWTVESIGTRFPDAVARCLSSGKTYRVEFEYTASNFRDHGHDPRECDMIICWANDYPDCALPVLALQNWAGFQMREVPMIEKENMYLWIENARLKRQIKQQDVPVAKTNPRNERQIENLQPPPGGGWRIEFSTNRRCWMWRRGRGKARETVPGGKTCDISLEAITQYRASRTKQTRYYKGAMAEGEG